MPASFDTLISLLLGLSFCCLTLNFPEFLVAIIDLNGLLQFDFLCRDFYVVLLLICLQSLIVCYETKLRDISLLCISVNSCTYSLQSKSRFILCLDRQPYNCLVSRTAWVSHNIPDFNEARDGGVAVATPGPYANHCTLLERDNQTSSLSFIQGRWSSWCPTNSVKALKTFILYYISLDLC